MKTRLLTKVDFLATIREPMTDITGKEDVAQPEGVLDLKAYLVAIPTTDLQGHSLLGKDVVEFVRRSGDNVYDHVGFPCNKKNVYLVVVVGLNPDHPHGHYLLNLNQEYGLVE